MSGIIRVIMASILAIFEIILLVTAIPIAILILIRGLIKHKSWLGFLLGFLPIILFGLLLIPVILSMKCPPNPNAPCEGPGLVLFLGIGVTFIYGFIYLISTAVIYLIYRFLFDEQHAIIHNSTHKILILSGISLPIVIGAAILIFNPGIILELIKYASLVMSRLIF